MLPSKVFSVAREQDDLITRRQALSAGVTRGALSRALQSRWQIVLPGVYATFTGPLGPIHQRRAAILYAGPGSLVTGAMACAMCGLYYGPDPAGIVDVLVGPDRRRPDREFVRLHRTGRLPETGLVVWQDDSPQARAELAHRPAWWVEVDSPSASPRRWSLLLAPPAGAAMDVARFMYLAGVDAQRAQSGDSRVQRASTRVELPAPVTARLLRDTRARSARSCSGSGARPPTSRQSWTPPP